MNPRTLAICGILALACLSLAFVAPTAAQARRDASQNDSSATGRYVLVPTSIGGLYLNDTATGDCWRLTPENAWSHVVRPKAQQ